MKSANYPPSQASAIWQSHLELFYIGFITSVEHKIHVIFLFKINVPKPVVHFISVLLPTLMSP